MVLVPTSSSPPPSLFDDDLLDTTLESQSSLSLDSFADVDYQSDPDPEISDDLSQFGGSPLTIQEPTQTTRLDFHGVSVEFPYDPYQSQRDMMDRIIDGAKNKKHCLLESPTGTGKTAAILCSLLAWQQEQVREQKVEWEAKQQQLYEDTIESETSPSTSSSPAKKFKRSSHASPFVEKPTIIYYAARTHSQIAQVIEQLKRTCYSKTPNVVLASRAQTCVNPLAFEGKGKKVDELCEKMRNSKISLDASQDNSTPVPQGEVSRCKFYGSGLKMDREILFTKFTSQRNNECWDIEDLTLFSKENNCCAYYGTRYPLLPQARIVFCTYYHLLHQHIRNSFEVKLEDSIVVFDEAHNIEDVCRDIASKTISLDNIERFKILLEEADSIQDIPSVKVEPLKTLKIAISKLWNWLCKQNNLLRTLDTDIEFDKATANFTSETIPATFTEFGFGPDDLGSLWEAFRILEDQILDSYDSQVAKFKIDSAAMKYIGGFLYCLDHLFKNLGDYHVVLVKEFKFKNIKKENGEIEKQKFEHLGLELICLNPALTFAPIKEKARTIIVTSGSLSPTDTFTAELNMEFAHILSAEHVVQPDKIFSAIVTRDDGRDVLNFSKTRLKKKDYFDTHSTSLAKILTTVCKQIQHGVLVFGPSKDLMKRLKTHWTELGCLTEMETVKDIYWEHESTGNEGNSALIEMLRSFRESIKTGEKKGAILFAYFRGKVSEGINFPDDEARAVVTIGIPLAPLGSEAIQAKMKYNDARESQNGLIVSGQRWLNGEDWYYSNAMRAINQAAGRCIRHSMDWGAILMCDSRLESPIRTRDMSKWIQRSIFSRGRFGQGHISAISRDLETFLQPLQDAPEIALQAASFNL